MAFRTTAFFDLLRQKSLEEGRLDRRRGIELAYVALASLDAIAEELGEDLPNRTAEGLVCLANAYRLADDMTEAKNVFDLARVELRRAGDHRDPLVGAELDWKEAALHWFERRYEVALDIVKRAISIFEKYDERASLAHAVTLRGCVYLYSGELDRAIAEASHGLERAIELER